MSQPIELLWPHTGRDYPTVPCPPNYDHYTQWPLPAPDALREAIHRPLRGLWIDHVPSGLEVAAQSLLFSHTPDELKDDPLLTGNWKNDPIPRGGHPEVMPAHQVMPDSWFDHPDARRPPPPLEGYTPRSGRHVAANTGMGMSGHPLKRRTEELPELWRQGLLRDPEMRVLAHDVLTEGFCPYISFHHMCFDEGWTIRRAAQVLREAGVYSGELCAWINQWAIPPEGTPPPGSAPAETGKEIYLRCFSQLANDGRWPLSKTEEIAEAANCQRVE